MTKNQIYCLCFCLVYIQWQSILSFQDAKVASNIFELGLKVSSIEHITFLLLLFYCISFFMNYESTDIQFISLEYKVSAALLQLLISIKAGLLFNGKRLTWLFWVSWYVIEDPMEGMN